MAAMLWVKVLFHVRLCQVQLLCQKSAPNYGFYSNNSWHVDKPPDFTVPMSAMPKANSPVHRENKGPLFYASIMIFSS
jgi:hypothetical protein